MQPTLAPIGRYVACPSDLSPYYATSTATMAKDEYQARMQALLDIIGSQLDLTGTETDIYDAHIDLDDADSEQDHDRKGQHYKGQ